MTSIELQGSVFDALTVRWLLILRPYGPDREQNSCQFRGLEEPGKLTYFNSLRTEQSTEQRAAIAAMR